MREINNLIEELSLLQGVGTKTATRYAYEILEFTNVNKKNLIQAIENLDNIKKCIKCNNYTTDDICEICIDKKRDKTKLVIVVNSKDINKIEKIMPNTYYYYVLGNIIDPLNGKEVEDLQIDKIIDKINEDRVEEVIFVLPTSYEGEITSEYIKNILNDKNITFSKLAQGIPIGGDLEYLDELTLLRSIEKRQNF